MNFLNRKIVRTVLCMLMVLSCLAGCAQDDAAEPTVPQWKWLREKAEYLTVPATLEDFALLEECVNLEYLDLTGSTCYDSILKYIAEHPQVEVRYTAPLGSLMLSNLETEAALEPGTYSLEDHQMIVTLSDNNGGTYRFTYTVITRDLIVLQEIDFDEKAAYGEWIKAHVPLDSVMYRNDLWSDTNLKENQY